MGPDVDVTVEAAATGCIALVTTLLAFQREGFHEQKCTEIIGSLCSNLLPVEWCVEHEFNQPGNGFLKGEKTNSLLDWLTETFLVVHVNVVSTLLHETRKSHLGLKFRNGNGTRQQVSGDMEDGDGCVCMFRRRFCRKRALF